MRSAFNVYLVPKCWLVIICLGQLNQIHRRQKGNANKTKVIPNCRGVPKSPGQIPSDVGIPFQSVCFNRFFNSV